MRNWMIAAAVTALATAAHGQTSVWGAFEAGESSGVGVQSADGNQLMLKCDKKGPGQVYAVVVTKAPLAAPSSSFVMRPAWFQLDNRSPVEDSWRFYEKSAIAINKGTERSLSHLMVDLADAKKLQVRLSPGMRETPVTVNFDVTGAREAIAQVFESCGDSPPS